MVRRASQMVDEFLNRRVLLVREVGNEKKIQLRTARACDQRDDR